MLQESRFSCFPSFPFPHTQPRGKGSLSQAQRQQCDSRTLGLYSRKGAQRHYRHNRPQRMRCPTRKGEPHLPRMLQQELGPSCAQSIGRHRSFRSIFGLPWNNSLRKYQHVTQPLATRNVEMYGAWQRPQGGMSNGAWSHQLSVLPPVLHCQKSNRKPARSGASPQKRKEFLCEESNLAHAMRTNGHTQSSDSDFEMQLVSTHQYRRVAGNPPQHLGHPSDGSGTLPHAQPAF